ncbi:zinc finger protein 626-like [Zophobas morio]|uniref:zinc finger protein 626-like n=1 Tax=Zophobas morio TaxID=2755281 RepID=UPI0030833D58
MSTLEYCKAFATSWRSSWKNVHNCKLCAYFTPSLFLMINHVRRHRSSLEEFTCGNAELEVFYCKDCDFKTELTILFKQHIEKFHGIKREPGEDLPSENFRLQKYVCEKCDFETNLLLKWIQHTSACTGKKENLPSVSLSKARVTVYRPYVTRSKTPLGININPIHLNVENSELYKCEKCTFKTRVKYGLQIHKNFVHLNEENVKWYECGDCPYKSKRSSSVKRHVRCIHLDEDKVKWYECKECPFRTKYKPSLTKHSKRGHLKKTVSYECPRCSYKGKTKQNLKRHLVVHLEIRSYQCDYCPYKAKRSECLKVHLNNRHLSGTDVKWYKCEQCSFLPVGLTFVLSVCSRGTVKLVTWFKKLQPICPVKEEAKLLSTF